MPAPSFSTSSSPTPDALISGEFPRETKNVVLIQNATAYKRGHVLGKITASGKYTISLSTAVDGSQTPCAICVDDIDATAADQNGAVFLSGTFNPNALTLGAAHTAASIEDALRQRSIFLKTTVAA